MFITTREVAAKAKTEKPTMQQARQGIKAQMGFGATREEAVDYIRVCLNLSRKQVERLK